MNDEIEQLKKKIAYLEEQVDRWEDDVLRLMKERNEARKEVCLWQGLDTGKKSEEVANVRGWDCFNQPKTEQDKAMDRLAELDEELGLNPIPESHLIKTLQAYDRLAILMENIMEHWLDGTNNPPPELIDAYYDVKDDINDHLNVDRLHEQVIPPNAEFYNTIQQKFKFDVDDTPNLW
jgi:hypothetical protein